MIVPDEFSTLKAPWWVIYFSHYFSSKSYIYFLYFSQTRWKINHAVRNSGGNWSKYISIFRSLLIQKQSSDHKTEATPSSDTPFKTGPKRPGSVGMGGKKFWFMLRLNRSKFSEMVKGHDRRDKFRSSHRSPGQCNSQSRSSNNRYTLPGLKDPGWLG